jgi:hypothetical protein
MDTFGWSVVAGVVLTVAALVPVRRRERRERTLRALHRLTWEEFLERHVIGKSHS